MMCVVYRRGGFSGWGFGMLGVEGRRYRLQWSGDGVGGARVNEELCEKVA